ncbi:DUF2956 domain-containing protein [Vibrio makurazakiensis]|uniref:DUF2956 domain-containing protein n=1 Tax=Vibrio makurazakiensis TaxID=2910250 RepID=UPI003D142759
MKNKTNTPSIESQQEAMKIAKATQKPGQTKEQTRLVAQGIEKGIALYKKQQKEKSRQADKAKKKQQKMKQQAVTNEVIEEQTQEIQNPKPPMLAWGLLIASWLGFGLYFAF